MRVRNIRPCIAVPCKSLAILLQRLELLPERRLLYPAREEEGVGIAAGAFLAGQYPVLLCQNSGLGNLVNAYCSLNQFFDIPLFFLISFRGTADEPVAAQKPMGAITKELLSLLRIEWHVLDAPEQAERIENYFSDYVEQRRSKALLLPPSFWRA